MYLGAFDKGKLLGIVYGHPLKRDKSIMNLQGIAVDLDNGSARKGIGSQLIKEFENVVKMRNIKRVNVGSADDLNVENFYLKNGYKPIELVAKGRGKEFERVKVNDYESGKIKKEELRKKYNPEEVIFIFDKELK